jgi:hypothetical protein
MVAAVARGRTWLFGPVEKLTIEPRPIHVMRKSASA